MNNFDRIKPYLNFDSDDDFYYLQIIKRRKENPELASNARVIQTYFVTSVEYLEERMGEIKVLCDYHDARAYINLNRRSFETMAFQTLKKVADQIMNRDYYSIRRSYVSVAGGVNSEPKKSRKWVVDVDTKSPKEIAELINVIRYCEPNMGHDKVLGDIPTKNGVHLISSPFNVAQFEEACRNYITLGRITEVPDIQKNSPTILYMNF
jgi:hypothetical protein